MPPPLGGEYEIWNGRGGEVLLIGTKTPEEFDVMQPSITLVLWWFILHQSGDQILSVDGESLQDVTHAEAVDIIRKSYNNKSKDVMEIVVIPKQ